MQVAMLEGVLYSDAGGRVKGKHAI